MNWQAVDALKQQIPLLEYLQAQDWKPARRITRGRLMGVCPLHADHKPSFLVDPHKNLFYCYGCGRGGDVVRFAELYHGVRFRGATALLRRRTGIGSLLEDVSKFYQMQLHRHPEGAAVKILNALSGRVRRSSGWPREPMANYPPSSLADSVRF